jgi:hypothetical protein
VDYSLGPIAIADPSHGLVYQTWTVRSDGNNIYLSAPNTPEYVFFANTPAVWVALAFDQNAKIFIAWTGSLAGDSYYYWYDTTIFGYRISNLASPVSRVFAMLDDPRVAESSSNDIILAYTRLGTLYTRQERDRFGVEYNFGAAPGTLVQMGMNRKLRLQFAFQNVTGTAGLPPQEWNPALGINEPA